MEKKEIKLKKSLLKLVLKSILLSIMSLFIIQHFGKITGGGHVIEGRQENVNYGKYVYTLPFKFENPISGEEYIEKYNPIYGIDKDREETYLMKLTDFYIPSLFGHFSHIVIGAIFFGLLFAFFGNYKIKIF